MLDLIGIGKNRNKVKTEAKRKGRKMGERTGMVKNEEEIKDKLELNFPDNIKKITLLYSN